MIDLLNLNNISSMMDFSSFWLYASGFFTIFSFICSLIFGCVHRTTYDPENMIYLQIALFVPFIGSIAFFILAIRKNPIFDFGFNISVLFPTIYFYLMLLLAVYQLVNMIRCSPFVIKGSLATKRLILFVSQIKLAIAFAYSSPTGIIISAVDTILSLIVYIAWPKATKHAPQTPKTPATPGTPAPEKPHND